MSTGKEHKTSILLVDDHAGLATALAMALEVSGFGRVTTADPEDLEVESVVELARSIEAGIVLLDLHLGTGRIGVPMVKPLIDAGAKVALFTASTDPRLIAAGLRAGAEAVIDKAMPFHRLVATLVELSHGQFMPAYERESLIEALTQHEDKEEARLQPFHSLTEREQAVLRCLVKGHSPKEIARREAISVSTVRGHIRRVLTKLDVSSQREALALARAAGWPSDH